MAKTYFFDMSTQRIFDSLTAAILEEGRGELFTMLADWCARHQVVEDDAGVESVVPLWKTTHPDELRMNWLEGQIIKNDNGYLLALKHALRADNSLRYLVDGEMEQHEAYLDESVIVERGD